MQKTMRQMQKTNVDVVLRVGARCSKDTACYRTQKISLSWLEECVCALVFHSPTVNIGGTGTYGAVPNDRFSTLET